MVPYFKEFNDLNEELGGKYNNTDEIIYEHVDKLSRTVLDFTDRNFDQNEDVKALPDGVYRVYEANSGLLHYDVSSNDNHIWQYHRNNGMTKISV